MKNNSKYLIAYLDKVIRPLVLISHKTSGYVKAFKGINKLMPLHIDGDKLLEKDKSIWTKPNNLKYIKLNVLVVYDIRYIKTKIRINVNKVNTNFHGLNVPDDNVECEPFTIISIDSLVVYESKYYLQVYLDNCT